MKGVWEDFRKPAALLALAGLALAWFAVFSATLSVNHEYDSLSYALSIEAGGPLYELFHPHHLIFNFLARQWHVLLLDFGFAGRAMLSGQLFDCLIGAVGVVIFTLALVRATGDRVASLLAAVGMASTYGYWHASNILAVRILNCVALCGVFFFLARALKGDRRGLVWLGLAHGFSILCHQTNALLTPAILAVLWFHLPGGFLKQPFERLRQIGLYLACYAGLASGVYLFVGIFVWVRRTPATFATWLFSYMGVHEWTRVKDNPLGQAFFGWNSLFFGTPHPAPAVWGFDRGDIRLILGWAVAAALAWIVLRGWWLARRSAWIPWLLTGWLAAFFLARHLSAPDSLDKHLAWVMGMGSCGLAALVVRGWNLGGRPGWALLFSLLWLGAYVPFFYWWEPWNLEFWLSCLPPIFILMALAYSDLRHALGSLALSWAWRQTVAAGLVACVCLLFMTNLEGKVAFDAQGENNRYYNMLEAVQESLRPQDLLVVLGNNGVPMYLQYFQPDRRLASLYRSLKRHPEEPSLALEDVKLRLRQELRKNRVYLLKEVLEGNLEDRLYLQRNFDLSPEALKDFTSRFVAKPVVSKNKQVYFYRLVSIRPGSFHTNSN